jgi:DNA ligase (NAD+)
VEKGGEIIPKITGVDHAARPVDAVPIVYPTTCPACGTPLVRPEGEAHFRCPNERGCAPQLKSKLEHYVSRKALNIDGLGAETVARFFDLGLVRTPADIYDLTPEKLTGLERLGEKSIQNLMNGIEASKQVPFDRVLFGLGIRYVGETVAEKLAAHYRSMDAIMAAAAPELAAVPEVGGVIAESLAAWVAHDSNRQLIERLRAAGVQLALSGEAPQPVSDRLAGQTFVLSGVFEQHSREEHQQLIVQNGGKITGSISKKLSYLVAGDKMGPAKREKATELKVPIISETDLLAMIPSATELAAAADDETQATAPTTEPTPDTYPAPRPNGGQQASLF